MKRLVVQCRYVQQNPRTTCSEERSVGGYLSCRVRDESTLLTMVAAVKPSTIAMMLIRISLATDTAEVDNSTLCFTFHVVKATTCLTATSERSITESSSCHCRYLKQGIYCRDASGASDCQDLGFGVSRISLSKNVRVEKYADNAFMADLYPTIAQTAVVVTALKVLLFPA